MEVDLKSPEMQKLKKENYPEYRKIYRNHKMKNTEWYCEICKNGKKLYIKRKMVTFRD